MAALLVVSRPPSASAACPADCWTGATSTDWFTGTNWTAGTPNSATNVVIDQGSPNANPTIGINAVTNAATSNTATIGDVAGTTGAVTVNTTNAALPASWTLGGAGGFNVNLVTGPLMVGDSGTGTLTITNGGTVTTTGNLGNVVIGSVGTGMVTVGSATAPNLAQLSTLTNNGPAFEAGRLVIGDTGTGTLIVNPDGVVNGFEGAQLGHGIGGQGTVIVNGGSLNVIDPITQNGEMDVGLSGRGTLTIENGGTVTSISGFIATFAGSSGSATVTGANSTWNITGGSSAGSLSVGNGDVGSLSILAGGKVNASGANSINIGSGPNSTATGMGTVTVDNGKLTANGAVIYVGVAGNPGSTMTVRNGGQVISDGGSIGGYSPASSNGSTATGVVTVTGAGSLWDAARDSLGAVDTTTNQFEGSNQFFVDNPSSMTGLAIQQGGQLIDNAAFVGDFSPNGSVNTVVVDGAGSKWTNLTSLSVGYFQFGFGSGVSAGAVNISNGGQVTAPSVSIGVLPDGGGGNIDRVSVSGAGSSLQASGMLVVGQFGTGDLTVSAGATVSSGTGIIGYSSAAPGSLNLTEAGGGNLDTGGVGANSVGTVTITGAGSTWSTGSLIVGDNTNTDTSGTFTGIGGGTASGTLTVANGGAVIVGSGAGSINVALNSGSTGTINIGAAIGSAPVAPGTISAAAIVFGSGTGSLVFNHTGTNYVFGASIQGPGTVDVESGTTVLTASSTYIGATTVNGGTLIVDGSTAFSAMTVNAGATLGGNGTVGTTAMHGGTLAPGNPAGNLFGPLAVQGSLSFTAASTYMIQVASNAGRTDVTAGATLGGATVSADFLSGSNLSKQYTILTAGGGVSGTFNPAVVSNNANVHPTLSYDAKDVFLNINLTFGAPGGLNGNQQAVADALTNFFNAMGSIPPTFAGLTATGLTQISGELATGSQQTTFDATNLFMGLLTDPFIAGRGDGAAFGGNAIGYAEENALSYARRHEPNDALAAIYTKAPPVIPFAQRWSVWAAGYGGSQTTDGNAALGSNTATSRIYGTAVGADYRFSPDTLAGFALAGGGTNFSIANIAGSGRSDLFQAGAFVRHNEGAAYLTAAAAYGWQDITTDRTITVAGVDRLHAEFSANTFSGRVESGYRIFTPWMGGLGITPYAAGQLTAFALPGYAESALSGASTFALSYASKSVTDTRSELGVRTDRSYALQNGILTLRGRLAWAHDYDPDRSIAATFQTLPGASFVVNGAAQAHNSALTTASADMKWLNGWSAAATFEGEFSDVTRSYAGKGVVRYAW